MARRERAAAEQAEKDLVAAELRTEKKVAAEHNETAAGSPRSQRSRPTLSPLSCGPSPHRPRTLRSPLIKLPQSRPQSPIAPFSSGSRRKTSSYRPHSTSSTSLSTLPPRPPPSPAPSVSASPTATLASLPFKLLSTPTTKPSAPANPRPSTALNLFFRARTLQLQPAVPRCRQRLAHGPRQPHA